MAHNHFDIVHQDVSGKTGRYCRILRQADFWWWDNVNKVFLETASVNSNVYMTEDVNEHGRYYGSTNHDFANGVYVVTLYDVDGNALIDSEKSYKFYDKTLIELVNEVRRRLRYEEVTDLTDPYSILLVDLLNTIQNDYMQEDAVWPELRMVTRATSKAQLYQLNSPNMGEFDFMQALYEYPNGFELQPFGDAPSQGAIAVPGRPRYFNIQYHTENIPVVFISPDPEKDQDYLMVYFKKPAKLVNAEDISELHHEPLILGAYALALENQGNDPTTAWQLFKNKMDRLSESEADLWLDGIEVTPT
jgi:hypothetical protein